MPVSAAFHIMSVHDELTDYSMTYVVEAARAATCPVWPVEVSHDRGSQDSGMTARAWPTSVALACLARCRTRCTTAAARVSVVTAETLSELLLPELLRFM